MTEQKVYTQDEIAQMFLWGLWRSIDSDYKIKYAKDCWTHFENAIKSASNCGNLKSFLAFFQRRLPTMLKNEFLEDFHAILNCNQDEEILNWFRTESTYMYLVVRLKNDELKELFKANEEEKKDVAKSKDLKKFKDQIKEVETNQKKLF